MGISRSDLVRRVGYRDIAGGHKALSTAEPNGLVIPEVQSPPVDPNQCGGLPQRRNGKSDAHMPGNERGSFSCSFATRRRSMVPFLSPFTGSRWLLSSWRGFWVPLVTSFLVGRHGILACL